MADTKVTAEVVLDSPEKTAFDLMQLISGIEAKRNREGFEKPDPRAYYLKLYNQCIKAAKYHFDLSDILRDK